VGNFRLCIFYMAVLSICSGWAEAQTDSILFSHPAGFYSSVFTLTLTSSDNLAKIVYTIDGSNPQTSATAILAGTTATISVNPSSTSGRPKTPAFIVRASLKKSGSAISLPATRTYIFIDKVKTQAYPGGDWPETNINGQIIDLEMDPKVVNDGRYTADMGDALLALPSISIVTDLAGLFDPATGIYVNATEHGQDWERLCSVELINPDGTGGFSINAGLRIRGGWSRHGNYPKHAFRFFFREEYGAAKLNYPLFGDEGVSEFDNFDLRCEENYSWANGSEHNTMVREVFSRDTQRDMNQPYTRSRYYHLYLDGMYWGIYQTQERSEAQYASDYLGGSASDYDVIKVNIDDFQYDIEATDGLTDSWNKIYTMCQTGFSDNANYFKLEGKDAQGNPVKGSEVMVDLDNLIDYMLLIFYTGNFDAPTTAFSGNYNPNNFFAVDNRNDRSEGFVFFAHDSEHSLMVEPISPGTGLDENRVEINMNVTSFNKFHPQWLHYKLTSNPEYRIRFADRVLLRMTGEGALTESKSLERFDKRVAEVEPAVIAESARWGDMWSSVPYTKDDTWLPEIDAVEYEFFPYRTGIVLDQLRQADLYPALLPPTVSHSGTEITGPNQTLGSGDRIAIRNTNATGNVYYTTDGSDPRKAGGSVSPSAIRCEGDYTLDINSPMAFEARVFNGSTWSALRRINFFTPLNELANLKVTEINYHPRDVIKGTDTVSGKNYEFIEFKNTGASAINLSGLVLDSAVYYEFPGWYLLPPGNFYVIATKPDYFYEKYGLLASGNCKGNFDNGGEYVLLKGLLNTTLMLFYYDDEVPFPLSADGEGYTLTASERNPVLSLDDYHYWMASSVIDGSPFADDPSLVGIQSVTADGGIGLCRVFPNPSSRYLHVVPEGENIPVSYSLILTDMTGAILYEGSFRQDASLDLAGLLPSAGMYILKISSSLGSQSVKIIFEP
jgi:CotH kinase protein/Lamin Tail Domain/Chitobiase/beta-hexosaminidase C-terminal domain